jgi:hypothetical protein
VITNHTFRSSRTGNHSVPHGTCAWNGTCGQPPENHARDKEEESVTVIVGNLWLESWPTTPPLRGMRKRQMSSDMFDGPRRLRLHEQLDVIASSLQSPDLHLPEFILLLDTLHTWRMSPRAWYVITSWIRARGDM